jgi:putative membrane-bound dehydrogenase-like protein
MLSEDEAAGCVMPSHRRRSAYAPTLIPPLLAGGLAVGLSLANPFAQGDRPPYSPQQSLAMFEVADGFRVELFAAEPLVADPIAMEIDEQGRVYVVELKAYPDKEARVSTIKMLEDTTGDGLPDRATVFADALWMPKGILRWRQGFLVPDGADLLYLEDSNGDGRADIRRVMLTGFDHSNPQSGINNPIHGLDNWVYVAHNSLGTQLRRPDGDGAPGPDISRRNFRYDPATGEVQPLSAWTQFGHALDAWGRHLLVSNANHLYQEVLPARALSRNPNLLVSATTQILPAHGPAAEVYPISVNPGFQLFSDMGIVTSASGIAAYLGGAFPPGYDGVTFVGEPAHNIVHADRLEDLGATFVARRLLENREFLASRDGWFRPVNFYIGPDGALYVLDYYRDIIEQPRFLSEEVMQSGTLYDGTSHGRIWRIVPEEGLPLKRPGEVRLGDATAEALAALLESPNVWFRRTAQRLLVDRRDARSVAAVERVARGSGLAEGRLHALWTLEGLGRLGPDLIRTALQDPHPGVRENAIRLAGLHLATTPDLVEALVAMSPRAAGKVAFQLLLTLGEVDTPAARQARDRLLLENIEEEWMQLAALSARRVDADGLLAAAVGALSTQESPARSLFFRRLGTLLSVGDPQAVTTTVRRLYDPAAPAAEGWWRGAVAAGLADRLDRGTLAGSDLPGIRTLLVEAFFSSPVPAIRSGALALLEKVDLPEGAVRYAVGRRAAVVALDAALEPALRADAISLVARYGGEERAALLGGMLVPDSPDLVQQSVVRAFRSVQGAQPGRILLERWPGLSGPLRSEGIDVLLQNQEGAAMLLDALEQRRVQPSVVGWIRSKRLMMNRDPALRDRAMAIFSPERAGDDEIVAGYAATLTLPGDADRGAAVFARSCSMCHTVGGTDGIPFGPDLATVRNRRTEFLLNDILLPNREITSGYELWVIELRNGEQIGGMVAVETPTSITVRSMGGLEQTLARADVARMEAAPVSAMPEGLGQQIDVQQMADLIAYLRRPPPTDEADERGRR